jgi:hypothetical protein
MEARSFDSCGRNKRHRLERLRPKTCNRHYPVEYVLYSESNLAPLLPNGSIGKSIVDHNTEEVIVGFLDEIIIKSEIDTTTGRYKRTWRYSISPLER